MRTQIEFLKKVPAEKDQKPVCNWMQLKIAPLVADLMKKRQPFPGKGH